jgi:hypothetical protein
MEMMITHEPYQISWRDFECVLRNGWVVKNGYPADLELSQCVLGDMADNQGRREGHLPKKNLNAECGMSGKMKEEKKRKMFEAISELMIDSDFVKETNKDTMGAVRVLSLS